MAKKNVHIGRSFNGVGELNAYLKTAKVQEAFKDAEEDKGGSFREGDEGIEFCMTETYSQAENLMLYGDTELRSKIEQSGLSKIRTQLSGEGNSRQLYSCVVGVAPNVPAFLAGTPNSMINIRRIKKPMPVVSIAYNLSISACESTGDIIQAAATLVGAILKIEKSGIGCNLWAVETSENGSNTCSWAVKIKESSQIMDVLKMAYPLAHPSMLRRQFFRLMEVTPGVPESFYSGYGQVIRDNNEALNALKNGGEHRIKSVISYYDVKGKSLDEVVNLILQSNKNAK